MALLSYLSTSELQEKLGTQCKNLRLAHNHSRKKASSLTGVPEGTLKAFENSGQISLRQLLMICEVYGDVNKVMDILPTHDPQTMDELLKKNDSKKRKRGRG
jgi:transcriptional regulator with XRE-family HTH domain